MSREAFEAAVERVREYIRAGDAFQVVLSQRLEVPLQAAPFDLYRAVRTLNPSPYLFFLELDGVSLVPLIDGRIQKRDKPLGFWVHPTRGIGTPSAAILQRMLDLQEGRTPQGKPPSAFREPDQTIQRYPEDKLPGPAAWIDGDYKLHRKAGKSGEVSYALYDLSKDPKETTDVSEQQPQHLKRMKAGLESWQKSVVRSLNGEDYPRR